MAGVHPNEQRTNMVNMYCVCVSNAKVLTYTATVPHQISQSVSLKPELVIR